MPSPSKDPIPNFPPSFPTHLYAPPSPSPHRTLRKLASAHNLGAAARPQLSGAAAPPSSTPQQRYAQQQRLRGLSPTRRQPTVYPEGDAWGTGAVTATAYGTPQRHVLNSGGVQNGENQFARGLRRMRSAQLGSFAGRDTYEAPPPPTPRRRQVSKTLDTMFREGPRQDTLTNSINLVRRKLVDGQMKADSDGVSAIRMYIWLVLLDAPICRASDYLAYIHRGSSPAYAKIRNDTFRTMTSDPLFKRKVSEASLIRLLNAIAWRLHDDKPPPSRRESMSSQDESNAGPKRTLFPPEHKTLFPTPIPRPRTMTMWTEGSESSIVIEPGIYVQGMNVLAAPFLYAARSEAEAFAALYELLTQDLPGYVRGAMEGVHRGLVLVDKVLSIVDPELSEFLTTRGMSAELYAFPSVLTLCACTPPLPEVLKLWDFLFAAGPHLNVVCIAAQLFLHKDRIMADPSPTKFLRTFPMLDADRVKALTLEFVRALPEDVYHEILVHAK